jgi:large subunit ribosomal protein L2
MSIKKFNAITPSLRHRKIVASIKHDPFEPLLKGKPSPGFRNNTGRITVRHRGGGHKRRMRIIDLSYKNSKNTPYEIVRLDYDPNRTGYLALCRTIPKLTVTSSSVSEK